MKMPGPSGEGVKNTSQVKPQQQLCQSQTAELANSPRSEENAVRSQGEGTSKGPMEDDSNSFNDSNLNIKVPFNSPVDVEKHLDDLSLYMQSPLSKEEALLDTESVLQDDQEVMQIFAAPVASNVQFLEDRPRN